MPTYVHECSDESCNHEWEDFYSITAEPPKTCPKCGQETARRLVSGGSGRGMVELYGQDLVDKVKGDSKALQKAAAKNENLYANLLGESRYHSLQSKFDSKKKR